MSEREREQQAHQLIAKHRSQWLEQLETAVLTISVKNGGQPPATLLQAYCVDPVAYGAMIEATLAIDPYTRRHIPPRLIALAVPYMPRADEPR